jgi:hypothetical protein
VTPSGEAARPDTPLARLDPGLVQVAVVPIRGSDGEPRPLGDIDAEVAALVDHAVAARRRCLVHVLAGSKTGLFAPSFDTAKQLRARFCDHVDIMVDACQMRVAPERVRACLAAGWMVLVTGSKFFGSPPFAGALLTLAEIVARAPELAPLPVGLAGYFSRAEWPRALQRLTACLPQTTNLGLVLRWQAPLWEMRAFQAVPRELRSLIMTEAGRAIRGALDGARWLRALAVATSGGEWPQTIFPFEVLRPGADGGAQPMESAALKQVHRWLNADVASWLPPGALCSARRLAALPCHVGQPVGIGRTAVLRVCIGAHLMWQTAFDETLGSSLEARLQAQIRRARLVVRKAELIAQYYDALCAAAGAVAPTRSA